jgi:prepilin-type processing-associated H-X9-DG protein
MYADEHNDWFPPARSNTMHVSWYSLQDYRKMLNMRPNESTLTSPFVCPKATWTLQNPAAPGQYRVDTTYGINVHNMLGAVIPDYVGLKRSLVLAPSSRLFFADSNDRWITGAHAREYVGVEQPNQTGYYAVTAFRHQGAANVGFFDGHAETVRRAMLDYSLTSVNLERTIWDPRQ